MIRIALTLYTALLALYPARFRAAYAADMRQIFLDQSRRLRGAALLRWWASVVADLLVSAAAEHLANGRRDPVGVVRGVASWALMLAALAAVGFMLFLLTELVLVPWDTAVTRPPVGSWQRTLNDLFEVPPGSYALALPLCAVALRLALRRPAAALTFAVLHLLFVGALWIGMTAAFLLNNAAFPYPLVSYDPDYIGYHRALIPVLTLALLIAGWLAALLRESRTALIRRPAR